MWFSDNFDEVNHSHFKSHAVQVSFENTQTARRIIVTDGDGRNITLIPVDASLKPGIRAYNFLGYLPDHEFRELQRTAKGNLARSFRVLQSILCWIYIFFHFIQGWHVSGSSHSFEECFRHCRMSLVFMYIFYWMDCLYWWFDGKTYV